MKWWRVWWESGRVKNGEWKVGVWTGERVKGWKGERVKGWRECKDEELNGGECEL